MNEINLVDENKKLISDNEELQKDNEHLAFLLLWYSRKLTLIPQCLQCKHAYGGVPCPIAFIMSNYAHKAFDNEIAEKIIDYLINKNGKCRMFNIFRKDLKKK